MVTDHKQQYRDDVNLSSVLPADVTPERMWEIEKERRDGLRKSLFPHLSQYVQESSFEVQFMNKSNSDTIIFANFNQVRDYIVLSGIFH